MSGQLKLSWHFAQCIECVPQAELFCCLSYFKCCLLLAACLPACLLLLAADVAGGAAATTLATTQFSQSSGQCRSATPAG